MIVYERALRRIPTIAAVVVASVGVLVLVGWTLHVEVLKSLLHPERIAMNPVTALAFIFFLATLIFYLIWGNFLYFLLATAFLIVQIFTMIGWWMQKRNTVFVYANGFAFKKAELLWTEIATVSHEANAKLTVTAKEGHAIIIPHTIHALGVVAHHLRQMSGGLPGNGQ